MIQNHREGVFLFYKTLLEYGLLWVVGGSVYYAIEFIFRGYSHWSMFVLGGICMMFFAFQGKACNWKEPIWKQMLCGGCFVVSGEFTTGIIVNKWLKLAVWDYSDMPMQLFGQICLHFALLFLILCCFGIISSGYILHWIFKEEKPQYRLR